MGCHQFFAFQDIDIAWVALENNNDEAHGGHIVERLGSGRMDEVTGTGDRSLRAPEYPIEMSGRRTSGIARRR